MIFGAFHGLVKVAADGVLDHCAQFFHGVPLSMDTVAEGGSCVAAVDFVFSDFKDDFTHRGSTFTYLDKCYTGRRSATSSAAIFQGSDDGGCRGCSLSFDSSNGTGRPIPDGALHEEVQARQGWDNGMVFGVTGRDEDAGQGGGGGDDGDGGG